MRTATMPEDVVLAFAELQPAIVKSSATVSEAALTAAVSTAVAIAKQIGIPVVSSVVRLTPDWPLDMIEPLATVAPIPRLTPGMFDDDAILRPLQEMGRLTLAVGGVSSEIAILHSVLGAVRRGYRVYVLVDCCGGLSRRTETAALREMEAAGATLSNVSSFFSGLVARMDDPAGQAVFSNLGRHWSWDIGDPPPARNDGSIG